MKKYAKKLMLMLLMLGMLVTVLPANTFAEENAANTPAEEDNMGNLSIKVTFKPLKNNAGIGDWGPIAGAVVRLTNNQTKEVIEYTTIKADPNGDKLEQEGAVNKTIPVGEYTMELVSVPGEYQDRFKWPKPKTITIEKSAYGDGFNLEEKFGAKFKLVYEDENGDRHPIPNAKIKIMTFVADNKHDLISNENGIAPKDGGYLYLTPWNYFVSFDYANDKTYRNFNNSGLYRVLINKIYDNSDLFAAAELPTLDFIKFRNNKQAKLLRILPGPNGEAFEGELVLFKLEATDAKNHGPIISDEVIEKGGKVDLTDNVSNIKDLPEGTKVEDVTEPGSINTNIPGEYTGKIKITYPDGSSLIKEVKVIVEERNRKPLFPWLELGKYESYGNKASKETPKATMIHSAYIKGYPDGTVRADGNVTRAEAVTMLVRLKGYNVAVANNDLYSDVKSSDWFSPYIDAAYKAGILEEKTGENFRPNEAITRAELAQLISHVDNKNDAKSPFADAKGHKFEKAIDQAYGNKRIEGYEDGTFRPDNKITRAEIAKILNSLFDRKVNQEGLNGLYIDTFKDLNKGHWGYYDILEASLAHESYRDENSQEKWTKLIK